MELLTTILWPLMVALEAVLGLLHTLTGSYGLSIICLSLLVSAALMPVSAHARRLEQKDKDRLSAMAPKLAEIRAQYKGQERFERIDEVYQQNGYHPIKSMVSLLPLLIQLPFLLAALFLLANYPPIQGQAFLFIPDLAVPDHLIKLFGVAVNVFCAQASEQDVGRMVKAAQDNGHIPEVGQTRAFLKKALRPG
jgi:membrane protein insertase Oxa1/YidC/SpoIIIJ